MQMPKDLSALLNPACTSGSMHRHGQCRFVLWACSAARHRALLLSGLYGHARPVQFSNALTQSGFSTEPNQAKDVGSFVAGLNFSKAEDLPEAIELSSLARRDPG